MKTNLSLMILTLLLAGPCSSNSADPPEYGRTGVGASPVTVRIQAESWAFGSVGISVGSAWITLHVWPGRGVEEMHDTLARGGYLAFGEVTGSSADAFGAEWLFVGDPESIRLNVGGLGVFAEVER